MFQKSPMSGRGRILTPVFRVRIKKKKKKANSITLNLFLVILVYLNILHDISPIGGCNVLYHLSHFSFYILPSVQFSRSVVSDS